MSKRATATEDSLVCTSHQETWTLGKLKWGKRSDDVKNYHVNSPFNSTAKQPEREPSTGVSGEQTRALKPPFPQRERERERLKINHKQGRKEL